MKLRICLLLTLCVVGIAGQSSVDTATDASTPSSSPTTAPTSTPTTTTTPTTTPATPTTTPTTPTTTPTTPTTTPTTPTTTPTTPTTTPTTPTTTQASGPTTTQASGPTTTQASGPTTTQASGPTTTQATGPTTTTGSSTPAPSGSSTSTTAAPPIPSPTPTEDPRDKSVMGSWNVSYSSGDGTCAKMQARISFDLPYKQKDNNATVTINVPVYAVQTVTECESLDQIQKLKLTWNGTFTATFSFGVDIPTNNKSYSLERILLEYLETDWYFPGTINPGGKMSVEGNTSSLPQYMVSTSQSYRCDQTQTIHLNELSAETTAKVELSSVKYLVFQNSTTADFGTENECSADFTTSDIVPIAVGCALAALVVVVLIAYLIGRRRSRQKGYQSV